MDRLRQKQDSIDRAFFIPMLELWSERKQLLTAAEVYARENERVMQFSPSFTLFASDFRPLMERVFAQLFRLGRFPKPPVSVLQTDRRGEATIAEPHVVYQGRIAMVIRRLQSEGIERTLSRLQAMAGLEPNLADHVDLDATFRLAARLDGVPEQMLRPEYRVKRLRREREQAAASQESDSALTPVILPAEKQAVERARAARRRLLAVLGTPEGQQVLADLEAHFETDLPVFQGKRGDYDPLDAMRRDAHREVFLVIRRRLALAERETTPINTNNNTTS